MGGKNKKKDKTKQVTDP